MLPVLVVNIHSGNIYVRVCQIVQIVIGILAVNLKTVPLSNRPSKITLHKEAVVPLPVRVLELTGLLSHNSAWIAPLRIIKIDFGAPIALLHLPKESHLCAKGPYISILPISSSIITKPVGICKLISSRCIEELRVYR